jgi:transcriptional regulator with XRE-family HTH domain/tetratricopeptide (TPR) repeat protein
LTLEQLSELAGVSVRGISDIERGISATPRRGTLVALAAGLDLSTEAFDGLIGAARLARTVDSAAPSTQRPARLRDFSGRDEDAERIGAHLLTPAATIVITGPGGFGKTTLAVESALRAFDAGSLAFVDLAGQGGTPLTALEATQAVLQQLDDELAEPPADLSGAIQRFATVAASRSAVIILDNAASEAQVRPILEVFERGPVLVTSRRALAGISATVRIHLDSLDLAGSLRLLQAVIPPAQFVADDLTELAALCAGVPLALRIAANRVASRPGTTVADYLSRLRSEERRLRTLVAGDLSIEATFALSYDELDSETAAIFRALSVIDGQTFDARIAAVTSRRALGDVEHRLDELADLGLVETRGSRYRLHDLLRVFAAARLADHRRELGPDNSRRALTYWLLSVLVSVVGARAEHLPADWAGLGLEGDPIHVDDITARSWVLTEADHWWPALQRVAAEGDYEAVLLVAEAVQWKTAKWHQWGRWHELNELALAAAQALGDPRRIALRAGALAWTAMTERGDPFAAIAFAEDALTAAGESEDPYAVARAHFFLGWVRTYMQMTDGTEDHLHMAIKGLDETGAVGESVQARSVLGVFHRRIGRVDEAVEEFLWVLEQMPEVLDEENEEFALSFSRNVALEELANCYAELGNTRSALETAERLMSMTEVLDVDIFRARSRVIRARALLSAGRSDDASRDLDSVDHVLRPYPVNGHIGMIRAEVDELRAAL